MTVTVSVVVISSFSIEIPAIHAQSTKPDAQHPANSRKAKKIKLTVLAPDCSNLPQHLKPQAVEKGFCSQSAKDNTSNKGTRGSGLSAADPVRPESITPTAPAPDGSVTGSCGVLTVNLDPAGNNIGLATVEIESYLGPITWFAGYINTVTNTTNGLQFDYQGPANPVLEGAFASDTQTIQPYAGSVELYNDLTLVVIDYYTEVDPILWTALGHF